MHPWCSPGVTFELGLLTVLVALAERMDRFWDRLRSSTFIDYAGFFSIALHGSDGRRGEEEGLALARG